MVNMATDTKLCAACLTHKLTKCFFAFESKKDCDEFINIEIAKLSLTADLTNYLRGKFEMYLREQGHRSDLIKAVMGEDIPVLNPKFSKILEPLIKRNKPSGETK